MDVTPFIDWFARFSSLTEEFVLDLSESLWIYPGVFALSVIDGFFPVVPSESVIIATATAALQTGSPILVLIFLCGAVGAWCGDQIAYLIGARADVRRWRVFKRDRWRRGLDWAEHQLERRGPTFIIAARFVPMGRVLVNLSAGALRFPHRRFMGVDAIAVVIWSAWSIGLGSAAGAIFPEDNLLLSISVGVASGVVLGLFVDKVLSWFGLSKPELPDLAAEIEETLTDEQREEAERHAAEREARQGHRAERRAERRDHHHEEPSSRSVGDGDEAQR
ncbi:DedA family protein [Demequina sp. SO4-18]|uniref:DedA family protein n=1 Tax=Demequina sp. SO4-18 TaxID=3401026 RepID=UPI003B5A720E